MAYQIIETCIACGLCVPECPIEAISAGDPIYIIDDSCCDFEDCLAVCPVDAIVPVVSAGETLTAAASITAGARGMGGESR